jgi:F420 biosynthesis protein FbiB-like protein
VELLAAIHARRSIRRYTPQPVPAEIVERLLTAATWAPSAHNRQPWRFVILTEAPVKERLARAMGAQLASDRLTDGDPARAVEADTNRSLARLISAPLIIVAGLTLQDMDAYPDPRRQKAETLMAVQSVAMAIQNLILAAHAEGLGACWMCAPLFCPDIVRAILDLPADWEAQALITLGYPANSGKPAARKPLANVVVYR